MFLLDTNVISGLRKARAGKADPDVTAWARTIPAGSLFLSVMVIRELELGVLLAERRDPAKGAILRTWLDDHVLPSFSQRILPIDAVVARRSAALHVPDLRPVRDGPIAATALTHGMTVATRNLAGFIPMGVPLLNPRHVTAGWTSRSRAAPGSASPAGPRWRSRRRRGTGGGPRRRSGRAG